MVAGVEIEVMERAWTGRSRESRNKKPIPCRYYDVGGHTGATARRCGARDHGGRLRITRRRQWERLDSLGGVLGQAAAVLCGSLQWDKQTQNLFEINRGGRAGGRIEMKGRDGKRSEC